MHTQRTEPYHSLTTPCKHSALMYCTSALSALNHTPPAVLHYTLRTPLTLPQRTELFVSLSLLSLPPLPMYMGLLACPSLGSLPSYTPHPYLGLVLSGGRPKAGATLLSTSLSGVFGCFGPICIPLSRARARDRHIRLSGDMPIPYTYRIAALKSHKSLSRSTAQKRGTLWDRIPA